MKNVSIDYLVDFSTCFQMFPPWLYVHSRV